MLTCPLVRGELPKNKGRMSLWEWAYIFSYSPVKNPESYRPTRSVETQNGISGGVWKGAYSACDLSPNLAVIPLKVEMHALLWYKRNYI